MMPALSGTGTHACDLSAMVPPMYTGIRRTHWRVCVSLAARDREEEMMTGALRFWSPHTPGPRGVMRGCNE